VWWKQDALREFFMNVLLYRLNVAQVWSIKNKNKIKKSKHKNKNKIGKRRVTYQRTRLDRKKSQPTLMPHRSSSLSLPF
jgi:hypothetical protein